MRFNVQLLTLAAAAGFAAAGQGQTIVTLPAIVALENGTTNMPTGLFSIDCSKQQNIAVEWTITPFADGAGNDLTLQFFPSAVPGTVATTGHDNGFIITTAMDATPVTVVTNFNCKGYSRLELAVIVNSTPELITNVIKYAVKPRAP